MSIERIAYHLGRNDEAPNKALAADLLDRRDTSGIAEIAAGLRDPTPLIAGDCLKVLYEIGERDPGLIAAYVDDFIALLGSKHLRLVWGTMTALAAIAPLVPDRIAPHLDAVRAAMWRGSVIAVDHGVSVLAALAASSPERNAALFPLLLDHLSSCRAKEVPQHSERALVAVNSATAVPFITTLERRLPELTSPQAKRVRNVIARAGQPARNA